MSTEATDEKIQNAFQKQFELNKGALTETPGSAGLEFDNSNKEVVKPVEVQPVIEEKPIVELGVDGKPVSKVETPVVEVKPSVESSLTHKTLEELLTEKSGGKYKTWEEIESLEKTATAPKEFKSKFAQKLEEFVAQGGDEEVYYATQSINFDKMSTRELLEYKIQSEDPQMTSKEVAYELKKRYGIDQWKENIADYEGGSEPEEIQMNKLKFERDANKAKVQFKEHQQKWAVPPAQVDETATAAKNATDIKEWSDKAREAVNTITKVPLKISENEIYDFTVDDAERNEIHKIVSELRVDARNFWKPFQQKDKSFDMKAMGELVLKGRNFDKAVALAADQAFKKGQLTTVKDIKNTDMKPDAGKPDGAVKPVTRESSMAAGIKEALTKTN